MRRISVFVAIALAVPAVAAGGARDVKLALRDRPLEKRDRPLGDVEADIRAGRIAIAVEAREMPLPAAGVEDRPAAVARCRAWRIQSS